MVVKVRSISTATVRGIGKPDYTRHVAEARQRIGLYLHYRQTMGLLGIVPTDQVAHPYPVPWIKPVLAPGASAHMVNAETGVQGAYTIPKGYTFSIVQFEWANNEDMEMWYYYDGALFGCVGICGPGGNPTFNVIGAFSTRYTDPAGAAEHTFDAVLINNGTGNLEGTYDFIYVLEAVGTPELPTVKRCQCPFCNHIQAVPVGTTNIICENCRKLYIVRDYSKIRQV